MLRDLLAGLFVTVALPACMAFWFPLLFPVVCYDEWGYEDGEAYRHRINGTTGQTRVEMPDGSARFPAEVPGYDPR